MRRRILALFLVIIMVLSTIPVSASPEYPETLDELEFALLSAMPDSTITLGADIVIDRSLDISTHDPLHEEGLLQDYGNYTINTNGYSLIVDGELDSATLTVGPNVTITGNSPEIIKLPAGSMQNNTLDMYGTISSTCVSGPPDYTILAEDANSFVNIYPGATINTTNPNSSSIRATSGAKVDIHGGTITAGGRALSLSGAGTHANITGGSLNGGAQALYVEYGATATLAGGTLSSTGFAAYIYSNASVTFTSGVVNGGIVGVLVQEATVKIYMPITSLTDTIKVTNNGTANIYAGSNITATSGENSIAVNAVSGTINMYGGVVNAAGGTGVTLAGDSSYAFTGGSIVSNIGVKVAESADIGMYGGAIHASGEYPIGILLETNSELTNSVARVSSGSINVDDSFSTKGGTVIHADGPSSSAYVYGGQLSLNGVSEEATTEGAILKATNDSLISVNDGIDSDAILGISLTTDHNSSVLLADGGDISFQNAPLRTSTDVFDILRFATVKAGSSLDLSESTPVLSGSNQIWVESDETDFFGDNIAFLNTYISADVDIVLRNTGSKATIDGETFTGVAYSYDVPRGATLDEIMGVLPSESISGTFRDITWDATAVDTSISGQYTAYGNFPDHDMAGGNAQLSVTTEVVVGDYPELTGIVAITGNRVYGETVTAGVTGTNASPEDLTYQWKFWDSDLGDFVILDGATSSEYVITSLSIGHSLGVEVRASGKTGKLETFDDSEALVQKAQNTSVPNAPDFVNKTATAVSVLSFSTREYRVSGGDWQSNGIFTGLLPNTTYYFQVRIKETSTHYASVESSSLEVTTNSLPLLQGTVGIEGQFVYGQTLTANTTGITSVDPGTLSYQWFRVDPVELTTFPIGSNSPTYVITSGDVGKGIALAVGASNYSGSLSDDTATIVEKAVGPTPGPIVPIVGKRTIELTYAENTFEYSLNGTTWQDSKVFSDLIPNTEYVVRARSKETATHTVSAVVDMLVTTDNLDTPAIPNAPTVLEKTATSISLVTIPGHVYTINNGETMNTHGVFTLLTPNTEYSFKQRVESTADSFESDWSDAALITTNPKAAQAAPSAPVLESKTYNSITLASLGGAKVALKSIGGVVVDDEDLVFGTLTVFTDLQPNTTYGFVTRIDGTDELLVSPVSSVTEIKTHDLAVHPTPLAPTLSSKTTTSITLVLITGNEYRLGAGNWQASNVFSGLTPNTEYTFYQRTAASPGYNVSSMSGALVVSTNALAPTPTPVPTAVPTPVPTTEPTPVPTTEPTPVPTTEPTPVPTTEPTPVPTTEPTPVPTTEPIPVTTVIPTPVPTVTPTSTPIQDTRVVYEIRVDAETSGNTSSAVVDPEKFIGLSISNSKGDKLIKVIVDGADESSNITTVIPASNLNILADDYYTGIKITTAIGDVTFSSDAIRSVTGDSLEPFKFGIEHVDTSTLNTLIKSVVKDRPVYDFNVFSGDTKVSSFNGERIQISVPYTLLPGESEESIIVYFMSDTGELTKVFGRYDSITKRVNFETTHFSTYVVGVSDVSFTDITPDLSYFDAVKFIAARDITLGVGDGTFRPNDKITRGQFITMLMRAYGITPNAEDIKNNFIDSQGEYYSEAVASAKKLGITEGVGGNKFSPNASITRQELQVLVNRTINILGKTIISNGSGKDVTTYSDYSKVAPWARATYDVMSDNNVLLTVGTRLDPDTFSVRHEMATLLYNIMK